MKKLFALIFMIITGIASAETTNPQEADIVCLVYNKNEEVAV